MITISRERARSRRPSVIVGLIGLAFAAGSLLCGAPALAQEPKQSWEIGCATRNVTPGPGDLLRTMNCDRQKSCQEMANARGSMMMEMGCIGVMPTGREPAREAGRQRPAQQQ
jgi:hypothetical protein